jgi:hypothetical protein
MDLCTDLILYKIPFSSKRRLPILFKPKRSREGKKVFHDREFVGTMSLKFLIDSPTKRLRALVLALTENSYYSY